MDENTSTTDEQPDAISKVGEGDEFPGAQPEPDSGDNGGASDEALAAALEKQRGGLKDLGGDEGESHVVAGRAAVETIRDRGSARGLPDSAKSSALDWFLNEDPREAAEETEAVELNFGTQDAPRWVEWVIKPVQMEVMRAVRRKAANTRAARQTGEVDEYRVNLEIVVKGTVDPDVEAAALQLHQEGRFPTADPVEAVRSKFQSKPGYVAQLAGRIMTLSGFNDEDVRNAERAAKN